MPFVALERPLVVLPGITRTRYTCSSRAPCTTSPGMLTELARSEANQISSRR
ncbi:MAG: hypothetical protein ACRDTH_09580 [Pseudonocardiaceae bacterium]